MSELRRFIMIIQDQRGYPAEEELLSAPSEPPMLHACVKADEHEAVVARLREEHREAIAQFREERDEAIRERNELLDASPDADVLYWKNRALDHATTLTRERNELMQLRKQVAQVRKPLPPRGV